MPVLHPTARLRQAIRLVAFGMSLATVPCAMIVPAEAFAHGQTTYHIGAGPLGNAITQFGVQAGVTISFDTEQTRHLVTPGLDGSYGVEEGLLRLLGGSGLRAQRQGNGGYVLVPADNGSAMELGPLKIDANSLDATSEGTQSYAARAVTIGKGVHTLKETPQAVTVMTRKMLDDQNLNTLEQVLDKTPGITVYDSPMGGKYFYSRGFNLDGQYQYDGVPLDVGGNYVQANSFSSDMAFYDRVEILKGAAGMMKGSGSSAGGVNFVRKRGQEKAQTTLTLSAGTWDNYRGQVDVGGPLNESGTVRGRAVATLQDRQYFYDNAKRQDQVLYGAIDWDMTPDTSLGVGLAYEDIDASPCYTGLPRYADGSDLKLSRSTCLGARWNDLQSQRITGFADLKHRFNDDWTLNFASVYTHNNQNIEYGYAEGAVPVGTTSAGVRRHVGRFDYDQDDYGFDSYVDGKFEAFGLVHELIVGANASRQKTHDYFALMPLGGTQNPFDPSPAFPHPSKDEFLANPSRGGSEPTDSTTTQYGTYATLRLKLAEPLTLVLGTRVSWYRNQSDSYTQAWDYWVHNRSQENGQVTPFAAVLYDLDDEWTAYASYADIFQPQSNLVNAQGQALQPKTGANYELGIKGELFGGALNTAFNLFRTIEEHRAETDFANTCLGSGDQYCYTDSGKVRAQGFEAEVSGAPIERLQLLAGYTYTQTKYLSTINQTDPTELNFTSSFIPRHMLKVWGDYQLAGALERWAVGAGVSSQSDNFRRQGNLSIEQAGYTLWSGRVQYRLDEHWSLALNGNNLLDKRYYSTIGATGWGNFYGEPRNFMLTLKGSF
ncbi:MULTISPECIES: TonB-dependent siderophore receptor [unclassified Pseudomonas]|uniref:TonB-dependent siderophore receptor n=1 Tax=unclassified Pseudomonas TaxID=196821 RepID=UPI00244BD189|nr:MULTISPECIES: TonB-dependent siderophore receptor [unclassified Pseudomonas]MDH0303269.1 TonB-dependent siderophore receptor [Pseudomonas sp. GD04091]MDH1985293.1 TonB-dependent siderophore receptor [Pseudomonas sp. GD03689]